ncbi:MULTISPECIES: hypothetical protein [unclassified Saccharicrinis]|uniref:hypothetical protein n=1 Tax=unclassified Saccharicrinis TaxID=2646859 RepID=UPI003D333497
MIARYSQYNHLNPAIEIFLSRMNDLRYRYYASELLQSYLHAHHNNIESSIRRAIAIMRLTGLPANQHFRRIYRSGVSGLTGDWKLSELACGLIILSFDETHNDAYQIQQSFLKYLGL